VSDDLIEFLNARLDEAETVAMAATGTAWAWEATGDKDNSWAVGHVEDEDGRPLSGEIEHGQGIVIDGVCESINGHIPDADHIARHDPARALREVAAKRAMLSMFLDAFGNRLNMAIYGAVGGFTMNGDWVLRQMAAVYSDHPDYRKEWAA
jgi:hypothetical protein